VDYQNIFKVPTISFGPQLDYSKLPSETPLTKEDLEAAMTAPATVPLGVQQNISYNVSVNQLIFSGQYIVGLQASKTFELLSAQALTKSKFDTKLSVSQAYYQVLVSEEVLKILQSSLDVINKTLDDMSKMSQQGLVEETDVDQIRVNKTNVENLVRSNTSQSILAYRLLKFLLGLDLKQPIALTDNIDKLLKDGNFLVRTYDDFNINNNIDYKLMLTAEEMSLMNLKREKSAYLPTMGAFYRHLELVKKPQFNFNFPDLLAISLSVPIFSSGMRMARVAKAKIAFQKTENQREQLQQGLNITYEQAKLNYNRAVNDYLSLKQSIELSDRIYKKTILKYGEGVSTSLDLTQAQNQFLITQSSYFNSILNMFTAQSTLERLLETE
jgi:outer membrane protein